MDLVKLISAVQLQINAEAKITNSLNWTKATTACMLSSQLAGSFVFITSLELNIKIFSYIK